MDGPDGYMSFVREPRIGTTHRKKFEMRLFQARGTVSNIGKPQV
jgi:hypothetical protein